MRRLAFCLLLLGMISTTLAQDVAERYFWEAAGVYIPVPAGWAAPLPLEQNGAPVLLLKPALTGAAAGGMTIQFKLLPLPENPDDLAPLLKTEFEAVTLRLPVTQPVVWLNGTGLEGFGTDEAETVYGRGRIIALDTQALVMMVSGPIDAIEDLNTRVLDEVFGMSRSDVDPGARPYGVLWQRVSTGAEGERAFLEPQAITTDSVWVYLADRLNGLLVFSPTTGDFVRRVPDIHINTLTAAFDGVYAVDLVACMCLMRVGLNGVEVIAQDFNPAGPGTIAADEEGRVFATDIDASGQPFVRVFQNGIEQDALLFEMPLASAPRLIGRPAPTLRVLTETGEVMEPAGAGFQSIGTLDLGTSQVLGAIETQAFLTLDDAGVFSRLDVSGQSSPVPLSLSPERTFVDLAIDAYQRLYTLEQSAEGFVLTAWTMGTVAYGTGTELLAPARIVTGRFDGTDRHVWLIQGQAGSVIDLTAELITPDDGFIMTVQLLDSSGEVLGTRTLTPEPSDLVSVALEDTGLYFLTVDRINGSVEQYALGYSPPKTFVQSASDDVPVIYRLNADSLSQALPIQRYIILGKPGIVFTAHVTATSGTLDPSLRLVNPRGAEVEVNEDLDPSLGLDAELTQIRLSNTGDYILEVRATSGEGDFDLTVTFED